MPTGDAAAKVRSIIKEQNGFEAAMHVARMGSRTGSRPVRKSFGETCLLLSFSAFATTLTGSALLLESYCSAALAVS